MKKLTLSQKWAYAAGQLGWATLLNIVNTMLVFVYFPPASSGLPQLITSATFFGALNAITLIAAAGRVIEAFTDPLIAGMSDRATSRLGRRTPFMLIGFLPAALACYLMFSPPDSHVSHANLIWLIVTQMIYYPAFSLYAMPHSALLIELTHDEKERVQVSTFLSLMYALSSLIAALAPLFAMGFQSSFHFEKLKSLQISIGLITILAAIWMALPMIFVREKDFLTSKPSHEPIFQSLKSTFSNPRFIRFAISDCCYWTGLNMITTGLLYYITVLLQMPQSALTWLMVIILVSSFSFYPLVNKLALKKSRKTLTQIAFVAFSFVFSLVFFLGKLPIPSIIQAITLMILAGIPFAFLGILPNTLLADIADHDALKTGVQKEGMYFAARTMLMKLGQTFGVIVFTTLLTLGREVGHDLGLRLSGVAGFLLCLTAAFSLSFYDEKKTLAEIADFQKLRKSV